MRTSLVWPILAMTTMTWASPTEKLGEVDHRSLMSNVLERQTPPKTNGPLFRDSSCDDLEGKLNKCRLFQNDQNTDFYT